MLRRYPDAIRSFVTILNFILRMRQYHTRSYQYDQVGFCCTCVVLPFLMTYHSQISKTADRMYALFAICNVLSPSRLDDNISNIVKERYSEQLSKMTSRNSEEAIPAFEELFLYACPKFMSANPPPYDDPIALSALLSAEPQPDPAHRHLGLFLSDVRAQAPVPTLRSFLKLYTSLDAKKLANFLDADEESMVQQMMAMKVATRSVSRVGSEKGLLEGTTITTSDLNFVINEVLLHSLSISIRIFIRISLSQNMVHIAESTVGRRYAGWFIRNTEHAQRVYDGLRNSPLPAAPKKPIQPTPTAEAQTVSLSAGGLKTGGPKVAWGGVKVGA
jgi:translation initiation factor 3 subunit L